MIEDVNFSSATSSQNLPRGSICIKKLSLPCIPASLPAPHVHPYISPQSCCHETSPSSSFTCLFVFLPKSVINRKEEKKKRKKGGKCQEEHLQSRIYNARMRVHVIQAESTGHLSSNNPLMHISQNKTSLKKKKGSPLKLHKCNVKTPERI